MKEKNGASRANQEEKEMGKKKEREEVERKSERNNG